MSDFIPPCERTAMRTAHKLISQYARRGLYAKAELRLLNAPEEYQAIIALCRFIVRLKYAGKTVEQAEAQDTLEAAKQVVQQPRKPLKRADLRLVPPVPAIMRGAQ